MVKAKLKSAIEELDGIEDVPLRELGLSIESIERSEGHIKIPIELLAYIKFCKNPKIIRDHKTREIARYRLRHDLNRRKSTKRGGAK